MSMATAAEWRDSVRLDAALLDPRRLAPHPRNVRKDLGDLAGLTASIAAQGVIEPLTVIQLEDRSYQIVAGHRRAAAAVAAGVDQVPCVIRRDLSVDVDADQVQAGHIGTMLAENLQRAELSAVEEAHGVQTMLDLGVDLGTIAAYTGLDRTHLAKAAGVARLTPAAAAAVTGGGLTLDQAAVVARFEDDVDAVGKLVTAAGEGPGRFAHAVTRAVRDRELAEAIATERAELEAAGRTVLQEQDRAHQVAARIFDLLHDGQVLDPAEHRSCPGSAVALRGLYFGTNIDVQADEVCTDPADNGHTRRWGKDPRGTPGSSMSDEELERQRAERRQVIENNQALAAANTTRRVWIRDYLQRSKAPKEVLRFAVEAIADHRHAVHTWLAGYASQDVEDAAVELGVSRPGGTAADSLTSGGHVPDARLPLQLLGHVAGAIEGQITRDSWRSTGSDREQLVYWVTFLVGQGYQLSDIEQTIVATEDAAR